MRGSLVKASLAAIAVTLTLAACSTPYGGPGGCLVLGRGTCTVEGKTPP